MRYRVMMSVMIEARDDREAHVHALQLSELLKDPMVLMAIRAKGIAVNSEPVVHQPQRTT